MTRQLITGGEKSFEHGADYPAKNRRIDREQCGAADQCAMTHAVTELGDATKLPITRTAQTANIAAYFTVAASDELAAGYV